MHQLKCRFCGNEFTAFRSDQRFCDNKCRNAFNNARYKKAMAPFDIDRRNAVEQDLILSDLLTDNSTIIISENQLEQLQIYQQHAKQVHIDCHGKIMKLVYTRYTLQRKNETYFQLKRK
jgi:hypothetical protein